MSEGQEFPRTQVEKTVSTPSALPHADFPGMKDLQQFLVGGVLLGNETDQLYPSEPHAFLPKNSDCLVGTTNVIQSIFTEVDLLIEEELKEVTRAQRQIILWEERIRKNHAMIHQNREMIQHNCLDIVYERQSRDFCCGKAAQVLGDYMRAETANTASDWAWLIKKYGLKNENGSLINHHGSTVGQLCQKSAYVLADEYQAAGARYEQIYKQKEWINSLLVSDNEKLAAMSGQLQKYIAHTYSSEVEPLQDGVLLLKELEIKLKVLERQESSATYGELRAWAEEFLDQFLRANSSIQSRVVTAFRRLTSIPLPAQNF